VFNKVSYFTALSPPSIFVIVVFWVYQSSRFPFVPAYTVAVHDNSVYVVLTSTTDSASFHLFYPAAI